MKGLFSLDNTRYFDLIGCGGVDMKKILSQFCEGSGFNRENAKARYAAFPSERFVNRTKLA